MSPEPHNNAHLSQASAATKANNTSRPRSKIEGKAASDSTAAEPTRTRWGITAAATLHIPEAEAAERFAQLKTGLPPRAARRMSRLGLMLSHLIDQTGIDEETVVLYASVFAEGRTLETYLESFPQPSPLGFQSSIHPGGIQQALILRQQPVREFIPITASESMPLALFRTLEQCSAATRVLLLGGEEHATWLRKQQLAADANFAFALLLEAAGDAQPLGWLSKVETDTGALRPAPHTAPPTSSTTAAPTADFPAGKAQSLLELCLAVEARTQIHFAHPDEGHWAIHWQAAPSETQPTGCTL